MLRLLPLVLGAFAIGAETFLVSSVLPQIAADLHVTAAAAGSLVTIFALAYAFGSPLIAVARTREHSPPSSPSAASCACSPGWHGASVRR